MSYKLFSFPPWQGCLPSFCLALPIVEEAESSRPRPASACWTACWLPGPRPSEPSRSRWGTKWRRQFSSQNSWLTAPRWVNRESFMKEFLEYDDMNQISVRHLTVPIPGARSLYSQECNKHLIGSILISGGSFLCREGSNDWIRKTENFGAWWSVRSSRGQTQRGHDGGHWERSLSVFCLHNTGDYWMLRVWPTRWNWPCLQGLQEILIINTFCKKYACRNSGLGFM